MMKRRKTNSNHPDSPVSQENESLDSVDRIGALPYSLVDRISALPDSVLSLILSCLPTKNAVATSVLSRRWKFVWRTVHNLDFHHWGLLKESYEGEDMRFVEFVNRVLPLNESPLLNRICLYWKLKCISVHVKSWISTAITRNVKELILRFENRVGPDGYSEPIEIPISVFTCTSLRSLELNGGIYITAAHAVWLPNLEKLELVSVNFRSELAFAKLISGCPMLNHLNLYMDVDYLLKYFGRKDHFIYIIHSGSLRHLEVCFEYRQELPEDIFYCSLILQASSLEYFKIDGYIHEIFVGKGLNSLVEADFSIKLRQFDFPSPDDCNLYVEAVRALDCAKILTLSSDAMWALSCATIKLSTKFKRLVKLEAHIYCFHCNALRQFIQNSDNLEVLTIYQRPDFPDRVHNATDWIAPLEVPKCLSNTLKKVVLDTYWGFEDERETIGYMLKHGSVLEYIKLNLALFFDNVKLDVLKDICRFPRKSPSCEVEFVVDVNGPPVPARGTNSNSGSGSNNNGIAEETVGGVGDVVEQPEKVAGSNSDAVVGSNDDAIVEETVGGGCAVEQPENTLQDVFTSKKAKAQQTQLDTPVDESRLYYEAAGGFDKKGREYGMGSAAPMFYDQPSSAARHSSAETYRLGILTRLIQDNERLTATNATKLVEMEREMEREMEMHKKIKKIHDERIARIEALFAQQFGGSIPPLTSNPGDGDVVDQPEKVAGSNSDAVLGSNDDAIVEETVGGGCAVEQPEKVASESPHRPGP